MIEEDEFLHDSFHVFPEGILIPRNSFSVEYQHEFLEKWIDEDIYFKNNRYINNKKYEFLKYLRDYLDDIRYHSNYKQDRIVKEKTE